MIRLHALFAASLGVVATFTSTLALAVPFTPVIDEFWILKDGNEIFRDSFNDAMPPPSGPDGPTTYGVSGGGGITSEAAGKLTLTPSLGDPVAITTTFADLFTGGIRQSSINSSNPNFLGQASSFEIHGLYDMSNLPMDAGQSFGIRATDRATASGNQGDNTYTIFAGVSDVTGDVVVALRLLDFGAGTSTLIDVVSIQALLGADQIEFVLSKDAGSDLLTASYMLYGSSSGSGSLGTAGGTCHAMGTSFACPPLQIYLGEEYIRAQFATTDRVALPEPATLALLGIAFAGLGFSRRRKLH